MAASKSEKSILLIDVTAAITGTMVTRTAESSLELEHGEVVRVTGVRSFYRQAETADGSLKYQAISWCQVVIGKPGTTRLVPFRKSLIAEPLFGHTDSSTRTDFNMGSGYGYWSEANMHPEGFVARTLGLSLHSGGATSTSRLTVSVEVSLVRWRPSPRDYVRYLSQSA